MTARRITVRRRPRPPGEHTEQAALGDGTVVDLSEVRGRKALDALIRAITVTSPIQDLVDAVVRLAEALVPAHRVTVHLPGRVSPPPPPGGEPHSALVASSIARVLADGAPIVLRLPGGRWRSAWLLPVASPQERLAVVVVWAAEPGDPPASALHAVALALDLAALALDRHAEAAALRRADVVDPLTGIANRRAFEHVLARLAADDDHDASGVVSLDIDAFAAIGDCHGSEVADQVLTIVAERLRGALRAHDLVARWDADEFLVLCRDVADREEVEAVARRLCGIVAQPMVAEEVSLTVTASAGVAWSDTDVEALPDAATADRLAHRSG